MLSVLTEIMQWAARVAAFGMAAFCYLFMLEITSGDWKGSISHFIQGSLLLIFALISWKFALPGGIIYIGLGLYILLRWRKNRFTIIASSILVSIGLLFIVSGYLRGV